MAGAEKNELLKEIAFLSNLIHSHKQQSNPIQPTSLINNFSPKKWTPNDSSSWVNQHRRVIKPATSIQSPAYRQALAAKMRPSRKVVASRLHTATTVNSHNAVHATLSSSANRTVALPKQVNHSRSVLIRSPCKGPSVVTNNTSPRASRSVIPPTVPEVQKISPVVSVPPLQVTVTSQMNNAVRAVTTIAPSTSRSASGNRTVVIGLENKVTPVVAPSSYSGSAVSIHRTVCRQPTKPIVQAVLKSTAYKWAAKPKLPPANMAVVKPNFAALVAPHKFTKHVAPHKFTKLNCPSVSALSYKKPGIFSTATSLKSTKLTPSVPLSMHSPTMRASGRLPVRGKLLKKTNKSKYTLVRTPCVRTERKMVKNLYTWFNARPGLTSTPRLKRKVGKYSLRYVKPNRTLKKLAPLPSSAYHYNSSNKSLKSCSVRSTRCKFGTRSLSLSRARSRITQKYKFFKKDAAPNSPKASLEKNLSTKLVMIGGILYKSSKNKLAKTVRNSPVVKVSRIDTKKAMIVTVRGVKFRMDSTGKTLQRIQHSGDSVSRFSLNYSGAASRHNASFSRLDLGGVTFVETRPGVLVKSQVAQKRTIASQFVNRSIHRLAAANKKSSQYCMFFNRFGKCHKKESGNCPYKHDADKVAVCTRFLQGSCTVDKCLFSHKVCRTKMPACSFFLEGRCSSDDCPYLHVNVNPKADICKDFLKGYCSLGEKCKNRHTYMCPEFQRTGKCEKGKKCFLKHAAKPKWKKPAVVFEPVATASSSGVSVESVPKKRKVEEIIDEDDKNLPFKQRRLPAFIKLADDSDEEVES